MSPDSARQSVIVGFDSAPRVPSGIARYTRELREAMARVANPDLDVRPTRVREWVRPVAARAWAAGIRGSFGATIDVAPDRGTLHATSVFAPPRCRAPLVVTVHDMVPFTHADTLTSHGSQWHRTMIRRAVRDADALVVPTAAVRERLVTWFEQSPDAQRTVTASRGTEVTLRERVMVAGGAASLDRLDDHEARSVRDLMVGDARPYVLFVGTIEPRKGLDVLLQALALRDDLDAVIVGAPGWGNVSVPHLAEHAGLSSSRFVVTGAIHDDSVSALMQGAVAVVMPSLVEGFGLPLVEAMSLGSPVVHSNDAALCEVAQGAGVVADILTFEGDVATLRADAALILSAALDDAVSQRESLILAGRRRAHDFSWDATATRVLELHARLALRA